MRVRWIISGLLFFAALDASQALAQEIRPPLPARCPEFHVRTPDMRGRTVAAMREQNARFTYRVTGRAYSNAYGRGQIISQSPPPGQCVPFNATLEVTVSLGPPCFRVPHASPDDLRRGSVVVGPNEQRVPLRRRWAKSNRPRGTILGQTPAPGSCPRRLPDVITVAVSQGPPACIDVPRVSAGDVKRGFVIAGDQRHVAVDVQSVQPDRRPEGEVIFQKPEPGACVRDLGGIVVVVSGGPARPLRRPVLPGGPLDRALNFAGRYWPGILAIFAGLALLGAAMPGKPPAPPNPARFAVRPRVDPGTQSATTPSRIEEGRRND